MRSKTRGACHRKTCVARQVRPSAWDTSKHEVARAALDAGAVIVNDVTALTGDPS
jgi:dihydropteroate synthase